jgi:linoleate 10R-lipoxygenase
LCPGYTISRAILADAVCLTRGDRFLTVDFTRTLLRLFNTNLMLTPLRVAFNLTSWGYQDCQYDKKDGSFGGLLTKLLFRTLPEHYQRGSAYAHFPFLDPVYMRENLAKTNPSLVDKYIWTRPRQDSPTLTFDTFVGVKEVLKEPHFVSAYDHRLYNVVKPFLPKTRPSAFTTVSKRMVRHLPAAYHFILTIHYQTIIKKSTPTTAVTPTKENELPEAIRHLHEGVSQVSSLIHRESTTDWVTFFSKTTEDLIKAKTFEPVSKGVKYVDIVKDVINILPILWISQSIVRSAVISLFF